MATQNEIINRKKGAIYKIVINGKSDFLKKGLQSNLVKETIMCVRFGIKRSNMKIVQEINQRPQEESSTPKRDVWWDYVNEFFVKHKKTGRYYLKCYLMNNMKPKVRYLLDGVEVDKEWLKENEYISKSSKTSYNEVGDLVVDIENLTFA